MPYLEKDIQDPAVVLLLKKNVGQVDIKYNEYDRRLNNLGVTPIILWLTCDWPLTLAKGESCKWLVFFSSVHKFYLLFSYQFKKLGMGIFCRHLLVHVYTSNIWNHYSICYCNLSFIYHVAYLCAPVWHQRNKTGNNRSHFNAYRLPSSQDERLPRSLYWLDSTC